MQKAARFLLRWEWLILMGLIPLVLFSSSIGSLSVLLIPLIWIARRLATGHFVPPTPFDLPILIMMAMLGISLLLTADMGSSVPRIATILLGIGLFYGTIAFSRESPGHAWLVVAFVILAGVAMLAIGIVGVEWSSPFAFLNQVKSLVGGREFVVPGTATGDVNANELAGVLSWITPLSLGCLIAARRQPRARTLALLSLLVTLLMGSGLVATQSRGAILALASGFLLVIFFHIGRRWRLIWTIALLLLLVSLIAFVLGRANPLSTGDSLGLEGRLEIWSRALLAIEDFPLTGVGVNGFRHVVHLLYPLMIILPDIDLGHAHNHLLQAALDLGLPGLVAYLAIWLISAIVLYEAARELARHHTKEHPYYSLVAGLAGSLLAGWVFGIFDAVALSARPSFLWWLLIGLSAAVHHVGMSPESVSATTEALAVARPVLPGLRD